jgi:hypothetical protein
MEASLTIGIGPIKWVIPARDLASLVKRFTRDPIYAGPCLILNRASGFALDATTTPAPGTHNKLLGAHAGPHQQWRLHDMGDGEVEITSELGGLHLTTMAYPSKWGDVWLDNKEASDLSTRWRLRVSADQSAFVIENSHSRCFLDAGIGGKKEADPHVSQTNRDPWQQWVIARFPLK